MGDILSIFFLLGWLEIMGEGIAFYLSNPNILSILASIRNKLDQILANELSSHLNPLC